MQNPTSIDAAIARVDVAIAALSGNDEARADLASAWADLVPLITPEPAAATKACPACKAIIMLGATKCGYCWKKLGATP